MNNKPTYAEIAQSLNLWRTYVDIDGLVSESEFEATHWSERVALVTEMYGDEGEKTEE
jgi:hypothetical protein